MSDRWGEIAVNGWMGFQLTQKLKYLKSKMKTWHKDAFGKFHEKKNFLVAKIQRLDVKEEGSQLRGIIEYYFKSIFVGCFFKMNLNGSGILGING